MLDVIWKILGVLGIILLILLCVIIVLLLLVLFYPVTYRVAGTKNAEALKVKVKINWLFGLLRGRFFYPEPGNFVVKLLWFTLYDSSGSSKENDAEGNEKEKPQGKVQEVQGVEKETSPKAAELEPDSTEDMRTQAIQADNISEDVTTEPEETNTSPKGIKGFLTAKYEKIKYTILKIYDKIKHIWENFTFYRDLWKDEQTQKLLEHAIFRLKKILRNIRPRRLKADIVFGTGEPDTTGYALAVYGILSPMLGKHVNITPDFEQSILQGEFYIAGHITIFQVAFHSLMIVFDKRLQLLKVRLDRHRRQQN